MLINNRDGLPQGNTEDPVLVAAPRDGIPHVIDTPEALKEAAVCLQRGVTPVALDVERAQGFRYGNDPYLVQIRREGIGTFLIDTAALPDLSILQESLRDTWLLHDAEQDLPNLRSCQLSCDTLFDTEIAARLIGLEKFGLAAVCEQMLGLALVKDHQAANWSVRPLPKDWLRYAALDVELLTELYRRLSVQLHELNRWAWAEEEFHFAATRPAPQPQKERWRSLPGMGKLRSRRHLEVARQLWLTRDELAQELDMAPGKLVRNSALIHAAQFPPRNRRSLLAIGEFRSPIARQYTDKWLGAITRGLTMDEHLLPPLRQPRTPGTIPPAHQWAKIDAEAAARLAVIRQVISTEGHRYNLAPEVILEPRIQRYLTWAPLDPKRNSADDIEERMRQQGARNWQIHITLGPITEALTA